ncbi:hypothetical protein [Sphingomonas sp.]|uniref:hypothetical protein n=1 Tax=Sphingomonas sp. TaxID=28214 RepID=UPI0025E41468|nr:hypothetical protein [Sphingomonas sp.]
MLALPPTGIHMMLPLRGHAGRGPIPARDPANLPSMGLLAAILGGSIAVFHRIPIFVIP